LAAAVIANTSFTFAHPVASNMVFLNLPAAASAFITELGWAFFLYSPGVGRFVCSWATSAEAVDELAEALKRAADHCQNSKETIG
jgi:threonine aldolase